MTSPAITTPFRFNYQTGQRSLLPRKQRRMKPSKGKFSSVIQAYETLVSSKGKAFQRRKYFVKPSGNGCFHDKKAFAPLVAENPYEIAKGKPKPYVIKGKRFDEWGNRLRSNAQYKAVKVTDKYYKNPLSMPFIESARRAMKRKQGGGKLRQHRSEGRSGICKVLATLLLNIDIHSLRVGRPDTSDKKIFHYHLNESLSAQSGLGAKSFQRHLELLQLAGVICMRRQFEKLANGEHVGKSSAIWFTRKFMKAMGLLSAFNRTSEQLTKREKNNLVRDIKTPEQVKAEATDSLCQEAGQIVSKDTVRKSIKELASFLDLDDSPPETQF